MPIVGLGADLVDADRIADLRRRYGARFLRRAFHPEEIRDCLQRPLPDQHLAARFAAKEALAKALDCGLFGLGLPDIRVFSEPTGRPKLCVEGRGRRVCEQKGADRIHLTISHEGRMALAVVILEGKGKQ